MADQPRPLPQLLPDAHVHQAAQSLWNRPMFGSHRKAPRYMSMATGIFIALQETREDLAREEKA